MKKLFLIVLMALTLSSCNIEIQDTGMVEIRTYDINTNANYISINNQVDLILTDNIPVGEMEVKTNNRLFDYLQCSDSSTGVRVSMERGYNYRDKITIRVSSKQFNEIEASGASTVVNTDFNRGYYNYLIDLSGGSLYSGYLYTDELEVDLSGASKMEVEGESLYSFIKLSGASKIYGADFYSEEVDVDFSGASRCEMSVGNYIGGQLRGASKFFYDGSPEIDVILNTDSYIDRL